MRSFCIVSIVEGHGEVEAVPVLIRRLVPMISPTMTVSTLPPIRIAKSKLLKPGELERAIELAARQVRVPGAVLILLDSDADCPAHLGPELLARAKVARPDIPMAVVLAKHEFEAWFIGAAKSLRGKRGLRDDIDPPADPESIQGAKEWLDERMMPGRKYSETLDQPALAALFDLQSVRTLPSFDKFCRTIATLLSSVS